MTARLAPAPLTFEPLLEPRVWGGRGLERYGKRLPPGARIGESWEISDVPGKATPVARGEHAGETLAELAARFPAEMLGRLARPAAGAPSARFPLLFKLLEASQNLSIQVHPSDADLRRQGQEGWGKTEAWVILEAAPGARIVSGLGEGVRREDIFRRLHAAAGGRLERDEEERLFRWVEVRRGDVVYIPAGTVHAVGAGIVLLEVQQTSDVTYRLYDWGRPGDDGRPRQLHLAQAEAVAREDAPPCPQARLSGTRPAGGFAALLRCEHFAIELLTLSPGAPGGASVEASTRPSPGREEPHVLAVFEGRAVVHAPGGESIALSQGGHVLLPASLGDYRVSAAAPAQVLRFLVG